MTRIQLRTAQFLTAITLAWLGAPARGEVIQWSRVGDAGNAAQAITGRGAVGYDYQIGTYDVTNGQYAEFLNGVDPNGVDPLALYQGGMPGITYDNGSSTQVGHYYQATAGRENNPVTTVFWVSMLRYANWLNNGQGSADTESGSYTLLGGGVRPTNLNTVTRNPGAKIVLPNFDEWYKAAYYKGGSRNAGYWNYATQSDVAPASAPPGTVSNAANYYDATTGYALTGSTSRDSNQNYLTDVGAYVNARSAYGTFDQNGDVQQLTETAKPGEPSLILEGGGSWDQPATWMYSPFGGQNPVPTFSAQPDVGFRVASVPEPVGGAVLWLIGGIAWMRRVAPRSAVMDQPVDTRGT